MQLTVNGEPRTTAARRLDELIAELGLTGQAVAVELNQHVVRKKDHSQTELCEGDKLELVTLVGGG